MPKPSGPSPRWPLPRFRPARLELSSAHETIVRSTPSSATMTAPRAPPAMNPTNGLPETAVTTTKTATMTAPAPTKVPRATSPLLYASRVASGDSGDGTGDGTAGTAGGMSAAIALSSAYAASARPTRCPNSSMLSRPWMNAAVRASITWSVFSVSSPGLAATGASSRAR
jgi:hypothetical protein